MSLLIRRHQCVFVNSCRNLLFHRNFGLTGCFNSSFGLRTLGVSLSDKRRLLQFYPPTFFTSRSKYSSWTTKCFTKLKYTFPLWTHPYLELIRFDKPVGTWLVLWPSLCSLCMAAPVGNFPDLLLILKFIVGAFAMRGAGCIVNDIWDKDFDSRVARTKHRPLAKGSISTNQAVQFLALNSFVALSILLTLNTPTIAICFAAVPLVLIYPYMKRVTYWPQAVLGLVFNFGVPIGWVATTGSLSLSCFPLHMGLAAFTVYYDTIYAHQDKADDLVIGLKSTALRFGDQTHQWLSRIGTFSCANLMLAGLMNEMEWPYYFGLAVFTMNLIRQLKTLDITDTDNCAAKFHEASKLLIILCSGILASNVL